MQLRYIHLSYNCGPFFSDHEFLNLAVCYCQGRHALVYHIGTDFETWEWVSLAEVDTVTFLDYRMSELQFCSCHGFFMRVIGFISYLVKVCMTGFIKTSIYNYWLSFVVLCVILWKFPLTGCQLGTV